MDLIKKLGKSSSSTSKMHVNRLTMHGPIQSGPKGINIGRYGHLIQEAFTKRKPKLVILDLNTPGGSPSQSDLIYQELMYWKEKTGIPLYIVVQEVCASGGIWIAQAADKVFVNRVATIGSIGVVARYFGFPEAMKKVGIENRVHTAGTNKVSIDPFSPETDKVKMELKEKLNKLHEIFKNHVINGRGEKLDQSTLDLFEGTVWHGSEAVEIGLVDALGYTREALESHPDWHKYDGPSIFDVRPKQKGLVAKILADTSIGTQIADALFDRFKAEVGDTPFQLK